MGSKTKTEHRLSLLQGALTLPLPGRWSVLASAAELAEIDTGVPGALLSIRVDRFEDRAAIQRQDFAEYITPGEGNPYPGLKWDPAEGYALLARPDHRGSGPHFVLVDALPFGPWIYRIECALPLRAMPDGDNASGELVNVAPIPTLMNDVLSKLVFDPPRAEGSTDVSTGRETPLRAEFFEMSIADHWLADPEPDESGNLRYLIEDSRDRDRCTVWLQTMDMPMPPPGPDASTLPAIASVLAEQWAAAESGPPRPDDPSPQVRPRGGPTLCTWRNGEALLKARTSYLDETEGPTGGHRIDDEYGLRVACGARGYRMAHFHICYPQEQRLDPAFQATANRLWLNFLEGRFLSPARASAQPPSRLQPFPHCLYSHQP